MHHKLLKLILFPILTVLLITGCSDTENDLTPSSYDTVNNLDGVTLSVVDESVTPTGLTLIIENQTDEEYTYGEAYELEQKIDGEWYTVPIAADEDYGFVDIGYTLSPNASEEEVVDWEWLYGSLSSGKYRIVKDMLEVHEPGDYENYYISAEFNIDE